MPVDQLIRIGSFFSAILKQYDEDCPIARMPKVEFIQKLSFWIGITSKNSQDGYISFLTGGEFIEEIDITYIPTTNRKEKFAYLMNLTKMRELVSQQKPAIKKSKDKTLKKELVVPNDHFVIKHSVKHQHERVK